MPNANKEIINIEPVGKDGDTILNELKKERMVIARSSDDFLYIVDFQGQYHMFSHTIGAAGGGQRQFPKNEKYRATVKKVVELADAVFSVEYDRQMNLYGVMATAEDAILSMFPSGDREKDAVVEFSPWDKEKNQREAENGYQGEEIPEGADPFGEFNPYSEGLVKE